MIERLPSLRGELLVAALDLVLSLPLDLVLHGLSRSSGALLATGSARAAEASMVAEVATASELFTSLASALRLALSLGRSHVPLAELALSTFERWVALYTRLRARVNASSYSPEDTEGSVREAEERSASEVEISATGELETDAQLLMELLETEIKRILPYFAPFLRTASSSTSDSVSESADGNIIHPIWTFC